MPQPGLRSHPSNLIRLVPAKGAWGALHDNDTPSWGIEPVPDRLRVLSTFDGFLLWANLSVSLLVIVAGAFLVLPISEFGLGMSLPYALAAIAAAAVVGNVLLGLAGFCLYQWLYPQGPGWWTRLVANVHPHALPWGGASLPSFAAAFGLAALARLVTRRWPELARA